jgi:hypothetical protein
MRLLLASIPVLASFACEAFAACSKEPAPSIPDGKGASEADMGAAQQAVKAYIASANAYLACVQKDIDSASTAKTEKAALNKQYNSTVDEMNGVAAKFNTSIKAYKAAH